MPTEPIAASAGRPDPRAAGSRVAELFEEHGRMVFALCRLVLRDREEAEDATQQTFLLAHRSLLGGVLPEQPPSWLAAIARNECYRRLGRRGPEAVELLESDRGGGDPADAADERAEIEALCQALAELPRAQREAIILREFYGLSYREVSAALDLSGPAVESLLFKSRRRLQEKLRPLHVLSGALVFPVTARDALAAAIPGFSGAASSGAGAAAGGAALTKLGAAPLAAKLAGGLLAVGAATTVTAADTRERDAGRDAPRAAVHAPPPPSAGVRTRRGGRELAVRVSTAAASGAPVKDAAEREREDVRGADRAGGEDESREDLSDEAGGELQEDDRDPAPEPPEAEPDEDDHVEASRGEPPEDAAGDEEERDDNQSDRGPDADEQETEEGSD